MKNYDLLIIGGDAAGMSAAAQARRTDNTMSIAVLEKGSDVSYAACGMPYFIADEVKDPGDLVAINVEEFRRKRNIEIRMNTEVVSVDFTGKTVTARSSGETTVIAYETLVIGTGARAFIPPIPGIDAPGIFYLRNLSHAVAIKEYIARHHPATGIIIGGGYIGLEMAETLRKRSIRTIMLEKLDSVAVAMSPEIRGIITSTILENGVELHTSVSILGMTRDGNRLTVRTDSGDYTADFILVAVGIVPNTDFLKGSGIRMNDRGAIIVDEKSRTNIPSVFAAGDCATVKSLVTGRDEYVPLGTTANKQGRVAGLQAAGIADEIFKGSVGSQLFKVFDLEVGKTGLNDAGAVIAGITPASSSVNWRSRSSYYPGTKDIVVTLTINADTRELIGGEVAGTDGAALRANVIAVAVASKMKIEDVAYLDLGYAPPFSPVWDPISAAAQKLLKRKNG